MHVRNKGHNGEREIAHLLEQEFNVDINRNVDQVRSGGADIVDLPPFAIEVKRCEVLNIKQWKIQATGQCTKLNPIPVIMFRQNRKQWRVLIPFVVVGKKRLRRSCPDSWIEIDMDTFILIAHVLLQGGKGQS